MEVSGQSNKIILAGVIGMLGDGRTIGLRLSANFELIHQIDSSYGQLSSMHFQMSKPQ